MDNHIKRKCIFYLSVAVAFFGAAFCVCFLATNEGLFYSICWGLLAAGYGLAAARIGFHLFLKDNSAEMWQVSIYLILAVTGWLIAILSNSWGMTSFGIAMLAAFVMMGLGTRFIRYAGDWVREALDKDLSFYIENARWKFLGDSIDAGEDTERALCSVNGNPLTVAEARKQGYVKEADEGTAYLQACLERSN